MPIFGGAAKHAHRCRGRTFTGQFDDCFNDYIPVLEVVAAFIAMMTAYFFFRFARSLLLNAEEESGTGYAQKAIENPAQAIAVIGAIWSFWRLSTYPLAIEMLPFSGFWLVFGIWFVAGILSNRADNGASNA